MSQPPSAAPNVPDHQLLRRVGEGSYGEVWLARNVMGTFRAIKIVHRSSFESDRPYEREFSGLQKFEPVSRTHPGFVSLLHIGRNVETGYFYCVMEVADDIAKGQAIEPENYRPRTLGSDISQRSRLPLSECVELGLRMAAALGYLHMRGLVHRDIKPSNIIFVNGEPKFADIGLVTDIGAKATFVGTEGYLAPEGPGSAAADIYALGKMLYEIGMGKSAEQFPELPTRLREWPEAPGLMRLNTIVLKACEQQPTKRFGSAPELEAALANLQQELTRWRGATGKSSSGAKIVMLCPGSASIEVPLAQALAQKLRDNGNSVFVDEEKVLSVEWGRGIEQQIGSADIVVPILSPASVQSEMMAYAFELAQQAAQRENKKLRVVALCAGLPAGIPTTLGLGLEVRTITVASDYDRTISQALEAIS